MNGNTALSSKRIGLIVAGVVVLLVVGLVAVGFLSIVWKQPSQKVVLVTRVCGDAVVTRYNKAMEVTQKGNDYSIDTNALKSLATEIKAKGNYQNDATCQTILLNAAIQDQNYAAAKATLAAVKKLHDQNNFVDSSINPATSISAYEALVQGLQSPPSQTDQEPRGGA